MAQAATTCSLLKFRVLICTSLCRASGTAGHHSVKTQRDDTLDWEDDIQSSGTLSDRLKRRLSGVHRNVPTAVVAGEPEVKSSSVAKHVEVQASKQLLDLRGASSSGS